MLNAFTLDVPPIGSEGVAQIGSSDIVFFSLFLAAAARLGLRVAFTWTAMTLSFGLTLALSYAFDAALSGAAAALARLPVRRRRPAGTHASGWRPGSTER